MFLIFRIREKKKRYTYKYKHGFCVYCFKIYNHMKLFVAGLPFDCDDQELKEIFEAYGTVDSAKVILDRETGKSRGFGFVEFADKAAAEAAISKLNGGELAGRTLVVKPAEDRKPSGGGGGFRSGGGGGGFRSGGGGGGRDRRKF
jgi:RNA recognition motif-containing protein